MQCTQCQQENREGRRFCAACGAPLPQPCLSCGFTNEAGDRFCGGCGVPLSGPGVPLPPTLAPPYSGAVAEQRASTALPRSLHRQIHYTPRHLAKPAARAARSVPDGEHKTITALFADILVNERMHSQCLMQTPCPQRERVLTGEGPQRYFSGRALTPPLAGQVQQTVRVTAVQSLAILCHPPVSALRATP